jgi:hypothetical protein
MMERTTAAEACVLLTSLLSTNSLLDPSKREPTADIVAVNVMSIGEEGFRSDVEEEALLLIEVWVEAA